MDGVAISLRGVVKRYGSVTAVDGLDLDVPAGTCFGLLGPNGAGKSTTMRMLTAQAIPDAGSIEILGLPLPERSKDARARMGVVPQRRFQRTYDAMLAAPVDVAELVTGEALWIALRAGTYGCAPLIAAMIFGLNPSFGMLLVPFIAFTCGFGFALMGIAISGVAQSINNFNYVTSAVITPLFLLAGTYFPLSNLPRGVEIAAQVNPLYHCVQLVRHAVLGLHPGTDALHLLALLAFATAMWFVAVHWLGRRLID